MPDIYESGMRGNDPIKSLPPKERAVKQAEVDKQKQREQKVKDKIKKGLDDQDDEEEVEKKKKKKKKGGFVLIPKSTYDKHIGSKKNKDKKDDE